MWPETVDFTRIFIYNTIPDLFPGGMLMKKTGLVAGVSFLAGVLFCALFFGYFQVKEPGSGAVLSQDTAYAQSSGRKRSRGGVRTGMMSFAPLVKKVRPAVVKVSAQVEQSGGGRNLLDRFFNLRERRQPVPGMGSGFFISSDGYLITNNHVVDNAVSVTIKTLDDKEYPARIIGTDPRTDLALLKIDASNVPFIQLGDSNAAEVGEWVLAIGNPLDQDLSVTAGIISAKGRQLGVAEYEDFLQTDAAINKGNSGGPLINMQGKVIGINSVILAPSGGNIGIGFAIPSNIAARVVGDLKTKGRVVRGHLGISVQYLNKEDAKDLDLPVKGCLVTKVEAGSPAENAGLEKLDLIVAVDGKKVKTNNDLAIRIADASPGDVVELQIYRGSKKMTIKVKVGEAPDTLKYKPKTAQNRSFDLGMVLEKNSPEKARQFGLGTVSGILVRRVAQGGPADENGIRDLDVILEINGKPIENVDEFRRIIAGKKPGKLVLLFIDRAGREGTMKFRLPK